MCITINNYLTVCYNDSVNTIWRDEERQDLIMILSSMDALSRQCVLFRFLGASRSEISRCCGLSRYQVGRKLKNFKARYKKSVEQEKVIDLIQRIFSK
jgi:hypothetical protein